MGFKFLSSVVLLSVFAAVSCKTNDVEPISSEPQVTLSANGTGVSEDGGVVSITATLSEAVDEVVTITIATGGTALNGADFSNSAGQITIPANSLTATITITALQDTLEEGNETIEISINDVIGATFEAGQILTIVIEDDDVPFQAQIIINEILYDPSNSGLEGDANGDGSYSQAEDEFIEFINLSSQAVDMSGYKIFDATALADGIPRHTINNGTILPPGGALVIFGGGTPTGTFGGALVQTSTSGNMNMSNAGDVMTLTDAADAVVVTFDIEPLSDNPNESYTRNPDITGSFEQHSGNTTLLFSPGTKIDGTSF